MQAVQEYELIDLDILLLGEEGTSDIGNYIYRGAIKKDTYCIELLYVNKHGVIYRVRISALTEVIRYVYFVTVGPDTNYAEWLNILSSESYPLINDMVLSYTRIVIPGTLDDIRTRDLRIRDRIAGKSYSLFNTLATVDYSDDPFSSSEDYCRSYLRLNQLSAPPVAKPTPTPAPPPMPFATNDEPSDIIYVSATVIDDFARERAQLEDEIKDLKSKLKAAKDIINNLKQALAGDL